MGLHLLEARLPYVTKLKRLYAISLKAQWKYVKSDIFFQTIHLTLQQVQLMFKSYLAILLIISLTASSFQRYIIYAGFEVNRTYIAKTLCVNRSRPWMHCNGRCYFMRKIKAAEESEKKQTEKDSLNRFEISFFQTGFKFEFRQNYTETEMRSSAAVIRTAYNDPHLQSLFRPPQV